MGTMKAKPFTLFGLFALFSFCLVILFSGTGRLLTRAEPVASDRLLHAHRDSADWLMYGRTYDSQRFSPLTQIHTRNVGELSLQWQFVIAAPGPHTSTPIVRDGVMFVTSAWSKLYALDARAGTLLWAVEAKLPDDMTRYVTSYPTNRGVAIFGDRIYWATLDAHLVALHAGTGKLLWERVIEDYRGGYTITLAPLIVNGAVIVGVTGSEFGIRGFIAAFDAKTGRPLWKTYTIPAPGEPGSETWRAEGSWKTGGGAPWLTGSYDPHLDLLYWGTGNPAPVHDGSARPGDNLYTNSMLAVEPNAGKIRWYFQFTPHDVWDLDGAATPILIDDVRLATGRVVKKALVVGNKNGRFYLLDRVNGSLIYASPLGRAEQVYVNPKTGQVVHLRAPTYDRPAQACGTQSFTPMAFSPQTGYAYVPLFELCFRYTSQRQVYARGQPYYGGEAREIGTPGGAIVALDVSTGRVAWRRPTDRGLYGLLTTGGGLVFGGDNVFMALDARTGQTVWSYGSALGRHAPPISYSVKGKQYIAVVANGVVLPKPPKSEKAPGHIRSLTKRDRGGMVLVFSLPAIDKMQPM
jgi:alcohol dehydrogenase (cytochrome c)